MHLRFRPYIKFLDQNDKILHLLAERSHIYLSVTEIAEFKFLLLESGVMLKNIPPVVLEFLEKNQLVELANEKPFEPPRDLSFLKTYARSSSALTEMQNNISNFAFYTINLSNNFDFEFGKLKKLCDLREHRDFVSYKNETENKQWRSGLSLTVVISESRNHPELALINVFNLANRTPWLLVVVESDGLSVGPYFSNNPPNHCYNCFLARYKSREENSNFEGPCNPTHSSGFHYGWEVQSHWLQLELIKIAAVGANKFEKRLYFFDAVGCRMEAWPYLPYPLCEVCRN